MDQGNEQSFSLDNLISEIRFLSGIARANGSLVSLKDVAVLSHTKLSEQQLEAAWPTVPGLATIYELKSGLILERGLENPGTPPTVFDREMEKRDRAEKYSNYARELAVFYKSRNTVLIAISGSTSYKATSEKDDLDFFCVTRPDTLWIFLAKALLLSRFLRISRRNAPRICPSYVVDQKFVESEFTLPSDALFARDALTTDVIHGKEYYRKLLARSPWIRNYFPKLYQQRTNVPNSIVREKQDGPSAGLRLLNLLLRFLVGNYIATKSAMINRRHLKQGRQSSRFIARIGPDHCIFESVRYSELRSMYCQLDDTPTKKQTASGLLER